MAASSAVSSTSSVSIRVESDRHAALERVGVLRAAVAQQLAELAVAGVALRAQVVRLRLERAAAGIGDEEAVDRSVGSPLRATARFTPSGSSRISWREITA